MHTLLRGIGYDIVIKVNNIFLSFPLVCVCAVRKALAVLSKLIHSVGPA